MKLIFRFFAPNYEIPIEIRIMNALALFFIHAEQNLYRKINLVVQKKTNTGKNKLIWDFSSLA